MSQRTVPPLPSKKPPVPLDFKLKQLLGGKMTLPIPPLSFSGGASGAESGIVDAISGTGSLSFTNNFKSSGDSGLNPFLVIAVIGIGAFVYLRSRK